VVVGDRALGQLQVCLEFAGCSQSLGVYDLWRVLQVVS